MEREMFTSDGSVVPVSNLDQACSLMREFASGIESIHARIQQGDWNSESASDAQKLLAAWNHNCKAIKVIEESERQAAERSRQEMLSVLRDILEQSGSI